MDRRALRVSQLASGRPRVSVDRTLLDPGSCVAPVSWYWVDACDGYLSLKFARWKVPSASPNTSCRHVPDHALSVFQT